MAVALSAVISMSQSTAFVSALRSTLMPFKVTVISCGPTFNSIPLYCASLTFTSPHVRQPDRAPPMASTASSTVSMASSAVSMASSVVSTMVSTVPWTKPPMESPKPRALVGFSTKHSSSTNFVSLGMRSERSDPPSSSLTIRSSVSKLPLAILTALLCQTVPPRGADWAAITTTRSRILNPVGECISSALTPLKISSWSSVSVIVKDPVFPTSTGIPLTVTSMSSRFSATTLPSTSIAHSSEKLPWDGEDISSPIGSQAPPRGSP
mmetsp:Transcript_37047/g.79013  ORF Transcript_37047/g.79013 Transcript_37047/m.79013 type:complete len:266 (+) Transcript_37047:1166-1963(+)